MQISNINRSRAVRVLYVRTINHKVRSRHGKYVPTCTRMVNITPPITLRSRRHWAILCHGGGGGGGGGV